MSEVEFEENNYAVNRYAPSASNTPTLVRMILKTGVVKDEKQANYVLIGIAICAVLLTFWVIKSSFGGGSVVRPNQNILPPGAVPGQGASF